MIWSLNWVEMEMGRHDLNWLCGIHHLVNLKSPLSGIFSDLGVPQRNGRVVCRSLWACSQLGHPNTWSQVYMLLLRSYFVTLQLSEYEKACFLTKRHRKQLQFTRKDWGPFLSLFWNCYNKREYTVITVNKTFMLLGKNMTTSPGDVDDVFNQSILLAAHVTSPGMHQPQTHKQFWDDE